MLDGVAGDWSCPPSPYGWSPKESIDLPFAGNRSDRPELVGLVSVISSYRVECSDGSAASTGRHTGRRERGAHVATFASPVGTGSTLRLPVTRRLGQRLLFLAFFAALHDWT